MEFQQKIGEKTKCLICPRECTLLAGQSGFCKVRKNIDGKICLAAYGNALGLAIDPIEKKPLYHFYPNSKILSFGTYGCCMGCRFCQNWHMTKTEPKFENCLRLSPGGLVETAEKCGVKSVAFTYNDPIVFFEYALDCSKLCKAAGIKTVAVTSGFMNLAPAKEFYKFIDGVNIDLKGFSGEFYARNCLARLSPVLELIKYVTNETPCWVELTTLLIENENDFDDMIKRECDWILNKLGDCVPLHFSAFTPKYKFKNRPQTKFQTLLKARKIGLDAGLKYVYTGNIATRETSATYCKKCGKLLISRTPSAEYNLIDGACRYCGTKLDGVGV